MCGKFKTLFLLPLLFIACNDSDDLADQAYFFDFETETEMERFSWRCRTLFERTKDFATHGEHGLKLEFFSGDYPGLKTSRFRRDWSEFTTLHFDVFNPEKDTLRLDFKIKDSVGHKHYEFLQLPPGKHHFALPFSSLASDNQDRKLDFDNIRAVEIYLFKPGQKRILFFDYFHLR